MAMPITLLDDVMNVLQNTCKSWFDPPATVLMSVIAKTRKSAFDDTQIFLLSRFKQPDDSVNILRSDALHSSPKSRVILEHLYGS